MKLSTQFGIAKKLLLSNLTGNYLPINVMISVTNRCPSHCSYCDIPNSKQPELSTAEMKNLLNQLRSAGCERIALWGGEPLVRPDILELVIHAKRLGLYATMDSNGYFVPKSLDVIRSLDYLLLSLDGPESVHDRNREAGSFRKVMKAIKAARGEVPIMTLTVITRNNLDHLGYILDLAESLSFVATFQLLYHNTTQSGDVTSIYPSHEEHQRVLNYLIAEKLKGRPVVASLPYLEHLRNWRDYAKKNLEYRPLTAPICHAGKRFCNVDVDGYVYPCNPLMREVPALNFLDVGFAQAFAHTSRHSCQACISCSNEFNLMSSVNMRTIYNWFRYTVNRSALNHL